jgi:ATP-dependent RNA helicase DeaD
VAELKEAMSASIFEAYIPLAQQLKGRPDGEYLTAFALKYFFTHHRIEKMTDVQKAEHKRQEHARKERQEASGNKELARRERRDGPREGRERGPRRERSDRPDRPERSDRGERSRSERPERPPREARAAADEIPDSIPTVEVAATLEESEQRVGIPVHEVSAEREVSSREGRQAREPRQSREPREAREPREGGEGAEGAEREGRPSKGRIWLSWGEADGADEAKLRELVQARAAGASVLTVEVRRSHAFLEVGPESLDAVVDGLNGAQVGDKALTAEKARRRRR